MPIYVYPDRIEFPNYSLRIDDAGLRVTTPTSTTANGTFSAAALFNAPMLGTVSGYTSGGSPPTTNTIDKFPFAANNNASDVGDLTFERTAGTAGQSSSVSGYTSGGFSGPVSTANIIDRFPFAVNVSATDVGDLTVQRFGVAGQSSSTSGYTSGGAPPPGSPVLNVIDRFPFATNASATDVGDISPVRTNVSGQSSLVNGYVSGGSSVAPAPLYRNTINRFPFATNADATEVAALSTGKYSATGHSSATSGYSSGGITLPGVGTPIDKFPFANNATSTNIGNLTTAPAQTIRAEAAGQSSSAFGYTSGGSAPPSGNNIIDRFPFATDAGATDVGDLTVARYFSAGQQY